MNKLIGLIGTTVGGGLIGAGVQRANMFGNKTASAFSKAFGGSGFKYDNTTWTFLICGLIVLFAGVYFSTRKR